MITLVNVIEINPFQYSEEEYEMPEIADYRDDKERYNRWENAISTLGLDLRPIESGEYWVDLNDIDDRNLKIILDINLKDAEEDHIGILEGGIVLMINNEIKMTPSCCGDIGNSNEWQRIFENESSGWSDLWIGHPWVFYKKEHGKVQFSDYSDENLQNFKEIHPIFEVDESQLKAEFGKIKQHQVHFKNRISKILKEANTQNAERIASLLTGIQ